MKEVVWLPAWSQSGAWEDGDRGPLPGGACAWPIPCPLPASAQLGLLWDRHGPGWGLGLVLALPGVGQLMELCYESLNGSQAFFFFLHKLCQFTGGRSLPGGQPCGMASPSLAIPLFHQVSSSWLGVRTPPGLVAAVTPWPGGSPGFWLCPSVALRPVIAGPQPLSAPDPHPDPEPGPQTTGPAWSWTLGARGCLPSTVGTPCPILPGRGVPVFYICGCFDICV